LFLQLTAWGNLLQAYRKASRGKRGRADVAAFEHRLEDELIALRHELQARRYRPGAYTSFHIHEPKRRLISAAPFRDRVVHHALCNLIEPRFERSFVADSYANRIGKGTHRALDRAQACSRRQRYVLQMDIRQFFPSIDHAILRNALGRKIADPDTLWLIDRILESGAGVFDQEYRMLYFPGDDLLAVNRPRGLPIGNLTSQFWANVYLNGLDHFIKRELRCACYVRYVDDLLLFGDDKSLLWSWKDRVKERLARLRLTVHSGAHPRPVSEGIPFLGFVIFPNRRRLKRRKGINFQRRLGGMLNVFQDEAEFSEKIATRIDGWLNHVRYANTVGLGKDMLRPVPPSVLQLLNSTQTHRLFPSRPASAHRYRVTTHIKKDRRLFMDISAIAMALTSFLSPALPFLIKGGEKLAEMTAEKLGTAGFNQAKAIWERLRGPVESSQAAKEVAQDVAESPDNRGGQDSLRYQLEKILTADPDLAQQIAKLLEAAGQQVEYHAELHGSGVIAQGTNAVAAGKGGVAIGGDVHGGVTLGGKPDKS